MDWLQVLTIVGSMIASVYAFFMITKERIDTLEQFHREYRKSIETRILHIDETWERLFERLLIQDKKGKIK